MVNLNEFILTKAHELLKKIDALALVVFTDVLNDLEPLKRFPHKHDLILAVKKSRRDGFDSLSEKVKGVIHLPHVNLTRMGQIKLSTIMGITEGTINGDDRIVCLTGIPASDRFDTLIVIDLANESEVLTTRDISRELFKRIKPEVFEVVLSLALNLASEGREGRAVGTTFVVGDHERVEKLSKPLIMNPFKGYPEEVRNILDETIHETIKEFSLLDGAFIIREDGVVMSAGMHLEASIEDKELLPGLGCRHMAAAGITNLTDAVAITISGSTGMVRVFRKGKILLEIERPSLNREEAV